MTYFNKKQANTLFVLLVSVLMAAIMSFSMPLLRLGWREDFLWIWLQDFAIGACLSIPAGFLVVPLIRRWVPILIKPLYCCPLTAS